MNKEIPSLYVLKAIAAFGVVSIHTPFLGKEDIFAPYLQSFVPLFFAISGFLMYDREEGIRLGKVKRALIKIFVIFFKSHVVYFMWAIIMTLVMAHMALGGVLQHLRVYLDYQSWTLWRILWIGDEIGFHLWYLLAYIHVLLFLYFLARFCRKSTVYIVLALSLFGFLGIVLAGKYGFIVGLNMDEHDLRGLALGLPCFSIGVCLKHRLEHLEKLVSLKINRLLLIIVLVLGYVEFSFLQNLNPGHANNGYIYLMTPITVFVVLLLFVRKDVAGNMKCEFLENIGKNYSLDIYIYHVIVYIIVSKLFAGLGLLAAYNLFGNVITFIVTSFMIKQLKICWIMFVKDK